MFISLIRVVLFSSFLPMAFGWPLAAPHHAKDVPPCEAGHLAPGSGEDLDITTQCTAGQGLYQYHNVHIYNGGSLIFSDEQIDFWAASILVEANSSMIAGTPQQPIGTRGGVVTIHLYGSDQGANGSGVECKTDVRCGVDPKEWSSNGSAKYTMPGAGAISDYFYSYMPIDYDGADPNAYFGYKVLAVSYDGTLDLYGSKGAKYGTVLASDSGMSWARLDGSVKQGDSSLTIDRLVNWQPGDQIAITSTDYVPSHSEQIEIATVTQSGTETTITVKKPFEYPHFGRTFPLDNVPAGIGPDLPPGALPDQKRFVETRAAVALLTRSIRIVSEGDELMKHFDDEPPGYYFGGHTIFRQGFRQVQIQGVEFQQMGQGGRIMHYPVHFHMARRVPTDTLVADCSVHNSMTRWYTLHATQGVTLARNVGYLSIGHGYYLEDGTETDNKFYSNIGIHARAAVENAKINPRNVPGIFAQPYPPLPTPQENVPFHSDMDHPTIFWITNAYNDFEYNMASGADTCGACYWLVPAYNSGMSRHEKWEGYASEQDGPDRFGTTPLYKFVGNYCSTAMNAFNTIGDTGQCLGVVNTDPGADSPRLNPIVNPLPINDPDNYYPKVDTGGGRFPTICPAGSDCSKVNKCNWNHEENCAVTVLDRFTTAFNFTETNFAAIWLRLQWYLVINSAISDVQNGGITFVTGGGYTDSDTIPGHWAMARKSVFIGNTQTATPTDSYVSPYASNGGPFNPDSPLRCATQVHTPAKVGNFCLSAADNLTMPLSAFGVNQRLFNIYDGPAYQDSNAYLNIKKTVLNDCAPGGNCSQSAWMYGILDTIPKDTSGNCYLPNAAIAWKQPNGFYYPPAFHSNKLFFDSVDIRHFVIEPLFYPNTFKTDPAQVAKRYCTSNPTIFDNFTDIDRQTELNDDDGSLTGLIDTISVNQDPFFKAPVETPECASDIPTEVPPGTATTSPYDYVTTVEYPDCGLQCTDWSQDCTAPFCYGVPLYKEFQNVGVTGTTSIRMAGQKIAQRSTLTVNHGLYYIDTTVPKDTQFQPLNGITSINVFEPGQIYYTFLLFAKPTTQQTYEMYVGPGFNPDSDVWMVQASVGSSPFTFAKEDWPSSWTKTYNSQSGVLTVIVDMGFPDFKTNYNGVAQRQCQPQSFCSMNNSNSCGCVLPGTDPLAADCQAICSNWTTKDVDCPANGCYGFGIKLPAGFTTGPKPDLPPARRCFPKDDNWNIPFVAASEDLARSCYYSPMSIPTGKFCPDFHSPPPRRH